MFVWMSRCNTVTRAAHRRRCVISERGSAITRSLPYRAALRRPSSWIQACVAKVLPRVSLNVQMQSLNCTIPSIATSSRSGRPAMEPFRCAATCMPHYSQTDVHWGV